MELFNTFDGFPDNYFGSKRLVDNGSSSSSSPILDSERGKLVRAFDKPGKKVANAEKVINDHLATLRSLIPGTIKMDKAALLAEIINQVKELRRSEDANGGTSFFIQASLCCDFKDELLSDLREALGSLSLKIVRAKITPLGSRMVNVFEISVRNVSANIDLRSVLDRFYASQEFSSRFALPYGTRRVSFFSSSNSSSFVDIW
ncbi:hypothetical protein Pfo_022485 [Paulownia fortunei]|nr:hypothetical protein Pfo_022485 [Paulownia fortunei]